MPTERGNGFAGRALVVVATACTALPAAAQFNAEPYASAGYYYDSNVARLSSEQAAVDLLGRADLSDRYQRYMAGIDSEYLVLQQRLFVDASLDSRKYDYLRSADNDGWEVSAGWDGKLGSALDSGLEYAYSEALSPFENRPNGEIVTETESIVEASVDLRFNPRWQWSLRGSSRRFDAPSQAQPGYGLREQTYGGGLAFIGVTGLSLGLVADQLEGRFADAATGNAYRQWTSGGELRYEASGVSRLNFKLGYSSRSTDGGAKSYDGTTGSLDYTRTVSGKTDLTLSIYRNLATDEAAALYSVITGGALSFNWRATPLISFSGTGGYVHGNYSDAAADVEDSRARQDDEMLYRLQLNYQPRRWLGFKLGSNFQTRDSSLDNLDYDATLYFIETELRRSSR